MCRKGLQGDATPPKALRDRDCSVYCENGTILAIMCGKLDATPILEWQRALTTPDVPAACRKGRRGFLGQVP